MSHAHMNLFIQKNGEKKMNYMNPIQIAFKKKERRKNRKEEENREYIETICTQTKRKRI